MRNYQLLLLWLPEMKEFDVEGELSYAGDRGESINKWISQV